MTRQERSATEFIGDEGRVVHATWSRSGRNLILTVARDHHRSRYEQVVLSIADARELGRFMSAGPRGS